eukprot:TRINITY_DN19333_c0_g1_i1.p1 TRINITY_DN19333_c0_g1~~TRINITY_DN19333_c0_g1_i1.p1  ORF type:complete len:486 (+),score=76.11 TRINITY_DN19333_c0_g1_i1:79-1536(+)
MVGVALGSSNEFIVAAVQHAVQELSGRMGLRVMVIGEAGLGKSTLVSCLLKAHELQAELQIKKDGAWQAVEELPGGSSTQSLRTYRYVFSERVSSGITFQTYYEVLDTPGFASQINNDNSWQSKLKVIEDSLKAFHDRSQTDKTDPRVHLCLYVLPPNPRPLKELDKRVMIELQRLVPVLPIISKADSFDSESLAKFQEMLRQEFQENGIVTLNKLAGFPHTLQDSPLAIIASSKAYRLNDASEWQECGITDSNAKLGRLYKWGLACCEEASDLKELRTVLLSSREFIVRQVDRSYQHWLDVRRANIKTIADGLAHIDAWTQECSNWEARFPLCRGPQPELGTIACTRTIQHECTAKQIWDEVFTSSNRNLAQLREETMWHARIDAEGSPAAPRDVKAWLQNMYKMKLQAAIPQYASHAANTRRYGGQYTVHMNYITSIMRQVIVDGPVGRLIAKHVDEMVHDITGLPKGFVTSVASAALHRTRA